MSLTHPLPAPDESVMKSMAKSLRKHLPEGSDLCHSKALEVVSNAFGFSSWHAYNSRPKGSNIPKCKTLRGNKSDDVFRVFSGRDLQNHKDLKDLNLTDHRRYGFECSNTTDFAEASEILVKLGSEDFTLLSMLRSPAFCKAVSLLGAQSFTHRGLIPDEYKWHAVFREGLENLHKYCDDGIFHLEAKLSDLDRDIDATRYEAPPLFVAMLSRVAQDTMDVIDKGRTVQIPKVKQVKPRKFDIEAIFRAAEASKLRVLNDGFTVSLSKGLIWYDLSILVFSVGLKAKSNHLRHMGFGVSIWKSDAKKIIAKIDDRENWGIEYLEQSGANVSLGSKIHQTAMISQPQSEWTEVFLTGLRMLNHLSDDGVVDLNALLIKMDKDRSIPLCEVPADIFFGISRYARTDRA